MEQLVKQWLDIDTNPETRTEIEQLWEDKNTDELEKRLSSRIQFGTAGLRARMEAGFSRMNDVTVLQASQGLSKYVQNNVENAEKRGVVIGHDHRHHSKRFADLTCLAFCQLGFTVYKFGLCHTPLVPFGVDQLDASCGIMITASHNPKLDNGYKVYWSNGCQIIPPHDNGIAKSIDENLEPWSWDMCLCKTSDSTAVEKVKEEYFEKFSNLSYTTEQSKDTKLKFVYTPMHGVGLPYMTQAAELLGLSDSMVVVQEQATPDPEFPTVKFPNPEEHGALDLAKKAADENGIRLIIANDPDADRFVAAAKSTITGEWTQLTGNQIGALFGYYSVEKYQDQDNLSKIALLNSTVSSEFNAHLAKVKGFKYVDTLTGFKWIGNGAIDLENQGFIVPFAYEEALGYMFSVVHDKDGISAAYVFLQLAKKWTVENTDALEKIQDLYREFGYFAEHNSYYIVPDPSVTSQRFENIRSSAKPYPSTIGKYKVEYWRDLTIGYDSSTPDNVPLLPVSSSVEMITAKVQDADKNVIRFTARGSGTEPKLKVYIEAHGSTADQAQGLADDMWNTLRNEWFSGLQEAG